MLLNQQRCMWLCIILITYCTGLQIVLTSWAFPKPYWLWICSLSSTLKSKPESPNIFLNNSSGSMLDLKFHLCMKSSAEDLLLVSARDICSDVAPHMSYSWRLVSSLRTWGKKIHKNKIGIFQNSATLWAFYYRKKYLRGEISKTIANTSVRYCGCHLK